MQYITASLAPGVADKIKQQVGSPRLSKAALRTMLTDGALDRVEFVSTSMQHRPGSWFTLPEAVSVYGPVGIQLRLDTAVVMIEADGAKRVIR